jgi:hypothetical protein
MLSLKPETAEEPRAQNHPLTLRRLAFILATGALALDYFFVGTFRPPRQGGAQLLAAIPWLPYLGVLGIWVSTFHFAFASLRAFAPRRLMLWGLAAGLFAFAVHSTAEFTLRIPAIGTSVFALFALLVGEVSEPRPGKEVPRAVAVSLLLLCFAVTFGWATWLLPRCLDYGLKKDQIFTARSELAQAGDPLLKRMEIIDLYRQAVRSVPLDDDLWQAMALEQFALSRQMTELTPQTDLPQSAPNPRILLRNGLRSSREAIRLNPLKAQHYRTAGQLLMELGRLREAVPLLRHSVELHPSIPKSWLVFATAAEKLEGLTERVCRAYHKADRLNIREVEDGRVIRGQYHERNLLGPDRDKMVERKLQHCRQTAGSGGVK